jgi:putative heme-binding domain-containing protein
LLGLGGAFVLAAQPQNSTTPSAGGAIFESHCAACHGLDGRGGEAPNIASAPDVRAMSDDQLTKIIHDGLTGGMPGFSGNLSDAEIASVVSYMHDIQHRGGAAVQGNAVNGKTIFFGAAQCSQCHMAQGNGGFIGPDLSGLPLSADDIRQAIVSPPSSPAGVLTNITLKSGRKISGVVRDEDNFSIQLEDEKGGFHFLDKADVAHMERSTTPLMPTDYGTRLTASDLQDLVAYLASQASAPSGRGRRPR